MLDVAEMLKDIWENVTEETIARYWIKSDSLPKSGNANLITMLGKVSMKKSCVLEAELNTLIDIFKKLQVSMHRYSSYDGETGEIKSTHVRFWFLIENDDEVREAVARDALEKRQEYMVLARNESGDDGDQSCDEEDNLYSVPSPIFLSSIYEDIETISKVAGVADVILHLRKAKRALQQAHDPEKSNKVR